MCKLNWLSVLVWYLIAAPPSIADDRAQECTTVTWPAGVRRKRTVGKEKRVGFLHHSSRKNCVALELIRSPLDAASQARRRFQQLEQPPIGDPIGSQPHAGGQSLGSRGTATPPQASLHAQ